MDNNDQIAINMRGVDEHDSRTGRSIELAERDAEPFIPYDKTPPLARKLPNNSTTPPLPEYDIFKWKMLTADPEIDSGAEDDVTFKPNSGQGIDDGFLPTDNDIPPITPDTNHDDMDPFTPNGISTRFGADDNGPKSPDQIDSLPGPNVVMINGQATVVPDVNVYQHKKTLAQGMMDLALLSANANQLRYVLESYNRHPYYYTSLIFISMSLIFQIAVGVGLILNSRYDVKDRAQRCKANKINDFTVIGIFIVTIVNVFVSAFGVADPPKDMNG